MLSGVGEGNGDKRKGEEVDRGRRVERRAGEGCRQK